MTDMSITISEKANELLETFVQHSGLSSKERVIEEAIFTIHEMIKLARSKSKTENSISAERFLGIISTFRRFEEDRYP